MKHPEALLISVIFFFSCAGVAAQSPRLTLTEALTIAMKNNFDIQLVNQTAAIAANNNSAGNAGMLPSVTFNAGASDANNTTRQLFSNGLEVNKSGVNSNAFNAGVALNWTIYDGMKMFATREKLQELEKMGFLSLKIQVENTLSKVIGGYYDIVQQKEILQGIKENLDIFKERRSIAEKRFEIGMSSKLELLQAKTDFNAQQSALLKQETVLKQTKIVLNQLLARAIDTDFDVTDSIPVDSIPAYSTWAASAESSNADLLYASRAMSVAHLQLKEAKSALQPKVSVSSGYLFARSQNQAGFSLFNQNLGLNVGLNVSYPLFTGFATRTQIRNASLLETSAGINFNQVKSVVQSKLFSAYLQYDQYRSILRMEEENVQLTREAVTIALERFRTGTGTTLELKDVQKTYQDAQVRCYQAAYQAKLAETELHRLKGDLFKKE